jgi:hypothetical protein
VNSLYYEVLSWVPLQPDEEAERIFRRSVSAARLSDGRSVSVLDPSPHDATTAADSLDVRAVPITDERFQFGAVGAEAKDERVCIGYWFPGTGGEVTYAGNTYPGGQLHRWRLGFRSALAARPTRAVSDYGFPSRNLIAMSLN